MESTQCKVGDKIRILIDEADGSPLNKGDTTTIKAIGARTSCGWWISYANFEVIEDEMYSDKMTPVEDGVVHIPAFTKYDTDKTQWSLLPWDAVEKVVKVIEYGAQKYEKDNWRKCEDSTRYLDACFRHLVAHASGDDIDVESGHTHLAHATCNLMFMLALHKDKE